MGVFPPPSSDPDTLSRDVAAGNRGALARAITLAESTRPDHRAAARAVLAALMPRTGAAVRLGVTGPPGVGKSTFIDELGTRLTAAGRRVAVLAVDPSSSRTGGSILGDKTRMARLALDTAAFVRPSPAGASLGGVAARTREAILLCEAAGWDAILVETVGVGQSETAVADLTDTFLLLALPGSGDELQGVKKGVVELADIFAVNKADGEGAPRAERAAAELRGALRVLAPADPAWTPPVLTVSGATGEGLDALWARVLDHAARGRATGAFARRRAAQAVGWMRAELRERVEASLTRGADARRRISAIEAEVAAGRLAPSAGAEEAAGILGLMGA